MEALLVRQGPVFSSAANADIARLKKLWLICFEDSPEAVDMFFEKLYDPNDCFIAKIGEETVSMLFLLPCRLCGKKAHYLYAACTAPEHRGKGLMRALINYAHEAAKSRGDCYSALLPANARLYEYYKNFGYVCAPKIRLFTCGAKAMSLGEFKKYAFSSPESPIAHREKVLGNLAHIEFGAEILDFAVSVNEFYGGGTVRLGGAYAIVSAEKDGARHITEFIADKDEAALLLDKIRLDCPAREYVFRLPYKNYVDNNCKTENFGMLKSLDGSEIPENIYIGLTLD